MTAQRHRTLGFTLLELLVVVAIMALAMAGVGLALRDTGQVQLEREAERLAALLEAGRAQSRTSGVPVRWRAVVGGFHFEGWTGDPPPTQWLSPDTQALGPAALVLGPEPLIAPQQVLLSSPALPGRKLRVATDGLHPFAVQALQ